MYRVNAPKIRGKMSEKGYTIASLAQGIGVNRNTLAAYLEHPEKIPFGKLLMMADLLCDTPCEAALIFLALPTLWWIVLNQSSFYCSQNVLKRRPVVFDNAFTPMCHVVKICFRGFDFSSR